MSIQIPKTASVTQLRDNMQSCIENLITNKSMMVLKHNQAVAYLLSPKYYEELLVGLEKIREIEGMITVIEDFYKGENIVDADQVFDELGL